MASGLRRVTRTAAIHSDTPESGKLMTHPLHFLVGAAYMDCHQNLFWLRPHQKLTEKVSIIPESAETHLAFSDRRLTCVIIRPSLDLSLSNVGGKSYK